MSKKWNNGKYEYANVVITLALDNDATKWRIITLLPGKKDKKMEDAYYE